VDGLAFDRLGRRRWRRQMSAAGREQERDRPSSVLTLGLSASEPTRGVAA
jgi:hypothetical protein